MYVYTYVCINISKVSPFRSAAVPSEVAAGRVHEAREVAGQGHLMRFKVEEREIWAAPSALAGTTAVRCEVPAQPSQISRLTGL